MLEYGGGGHENAGTCQVDNDRAEEVKRALIERVRAEHWEELRQSA
jgi:nanoRNase/pAp phosphatase (c-di-AMP/oligoRNAs hydrolase)